MVLTIQNVHDKLIRAMVKIQSTQPFFSYILMNFKITAEQDKTMPTCAVDKEGNFFYNEPFIGGLTPEELQGVLVHETMHICKGDFFRKGNRDAMIWNIASDMVINFILKQEGFTMPKCAINPNSAGNVTIADKKYNVANKVTEEIYDELLKNADKIKSIMPGDGKGGHGGFDIHIPIGNDQAENANAESKWKKVVITAATNARARGNLPGCVEGLVDKLLNPTIDWRSRILRFITNEIPVDYTNRLPSRKFYGTGVWAPKILRENIEVFVSVDVSGSTINDREYFMSEVFGILNAYEQIKARLIFWDATVHPENDYLITRDNRNSLTELKIKNCNGGTSLSCYAEYCEKKNYKCRIHIILTDGEVESKPKVPDGNVIFVLSKGGTDKHIKNLGAVCNITDIEE